jgi:hypothetical protein
MSVGIRLGKVVRLDETMSNEVGVEQNERETTLNSRHCSATQI